MNEKHTKRLQNIYLKHLCCQYNDISLLKNVLGKFYVRAALRKHLYFVITLYFTTIV